MVPWMVLGGLIFLLWTGAPIFLQRMLRGTALGGGDNFRETEPHNWLIYASSALASANERQYTSI